MESQTLPTRTDLQLLARVQFRDAGGEARECFGNVLELGERGMRLEAGRPLDPGLHLLVHVVFPGQRGYPRPQVPLNYIVRRARDEESLHYDLEMTAVDKEAYERLALYLRREPPVRRDRRAELFG